MIDRKALALLTAGALLFILLAWSPLLQTFGAPLHIELPDRSPTETVSTVVAAVSATPTSAAILLSGDTNFVLTQNSNCYSGPGEEFDVVVPLEAEDAVQVIGKNPSGTWWRITPDGATTCWIVMEAGIFTGQSGLIPITSAGGGTNIPPPSVPTRRGAIAVTGNANPSNAIASSTLLPTQPARDTDQPATSTPRPATSTPRPPVATVRPATSTQRPANTNTPRPPNTRRPPTHTPRPADTNTPRPPNTRRPPTSTPRFVTSTPRPPTATAPPATSTPRPPTATERPITNTPRPPTETLVPPPTNTDPPPPTEPPPTEPPPTEPPPTEPPPTEPPPTEPPPTDPPATDAPTELPTEPVAP